MQAIQTKFLSPTNFRASRLKAWAQCGSVTVDWDHHLNVEENHERAARALQEKLGWKGQYYGELVGGALPSGGYAFVFCNEASK